MNLKLLHSLPKNVRIYNISWGLNHQLKLLAELVPWQGIRSQRDKRSRVRISTTSHLKRNTQRLCASTLLTQWALVWGGVLEYITYFGASTINLSFWLSWFLYKKSLDFCLFCVIVIAEFDGGRPFNLLMLSRWMGICWLFPYTDAAIITNVLLLLSCFRLARMLLIIMWASLWTCFAVVFLIFRLLSDNDCKVCILF